VIAMPRTVIVGAGPAGMAEACVLAGRGLRPIVLDEGRQPGGQAYRRPTAPIASGVQAARGERLHAAFAAALPQIDYRPATLVWNIADGAVHTLHGSRVQAEPYDVLILATGAIDRVLPVAGWTLPGVVTLGGAQTLLKDQGCLVGRRVVFCGSSPLLYLAARQYQRVGGMIAAVLDTTPLRLKLMALPDLACAPGALLRGLGWIAALRAAGVPVHTGVRLLQIDGAEGVSGLSFRTATGRIGRLAADAVALGFGLQAQTQLAQLAGCRMRVDAVFRQLVPDADSDGRCARGLFAVGDGAAIGGADVAEWSGSLAALALLRDLGEPVPEATMDRLRRRIGRLRRFQRGLAAAFAWPADALAETADPVVLCRCEGVTFGAVRQAIRQPIGVADANRAKALTRCGMGRCQGRFCGPALSELVAQERGIALAEAGWLRPQAPVKPLPLAAALGA
jgi:NADPH-dependent 2,4-dienoyl-CoA reductase/sulfur reductase-like enzyme